MHVLYVPPNRAYSLVVVQDTGCALSCQVIEPMDLRLALHLSLLLIGIVIVLLADGFVIKLDFLLITAAASKYLTLSPAHVKAADHHIAKHQIDSHRQHDGFHGNWVSQIHINSRPSHECPQDDSYQKADAQDKDVAAVDNSVLFLMAPKELGSDARHAVAGHSAGESNPNQNVDNQINLCQY